MIGMTRAALIWIKSTHPVTQLLASTSGVFEKNAYRNTSEAAQDDIDVF